METLYTMNLFWGPLAVIILSKALLFIGHLWVFSSNCGVLFAGLNKKMNFLHEVIFLGSGSAHSSF